MRKFYALSFMKIVPALIGFLTFTQVYCYKATAQQFTAGRLVVERVGTGSGQTSAGTPIFLDEYTIGGAAGVSVALPTVTGPVINRTVESGVATSAGMITRSQDGKYITVPGYDAAVGTPGVTSAIVNKVITRVDANGGVASTVLTNATTFSGNSFRGVASTDGSGYWLSGAGNGPVYVTHTGSTTPVAGTEVSTTITDTRSTFIYNSQVYQSTGVGAATGVYNAGVGLPMTTGNTMTAAINTGGTGDPYQFVIVNNGLPVMYVADYNNKLIRKYFQVGPTWFFAGSTTITLGGVATGFYGITANVVAGPAVNLYLTTTNIIGSNSRIVTFTDFTSASTTITGSTAGTTIAGPTTNTAFHGIAFVPFNVTAINTAAASVCSGMGTTITISGTPGTSVIYKIGAFPQPAVIIGSGGTYSFNTGPLAASATYTVISATDGSLTQTYAYGVIVNVNPLPVITAGGASVICSGSPTVLTAGGGLTYTWSPGATLSATTGNSVIASPTSLTNYTVTGTDVNGCINKAVVTITTNPAPIVIAGPASVICNGSSATITASGAATYSWSPSTGLSATTGNIVTASPAVTTTYTVTGTNAIGCTNTATSTVTVNALPTIVASPDVTICNGTPTGLSATGAITYKWSPATGLSATTGSSVTASPIATTNYTITGTDANGCKNTAPLNVSVNPLPPVTVSPGGAICIGASVGVLIAGGATTYTWAPGTGLSQTTGNTVIASPAVTTTYTVTGTDGNGCIKSAIATVTVNPLPIISTGTAVAICTGSSTLLAASGGVSYTWSPSLGLSATTGSSVTANPVTTTTYLITGTDINGCVNTITNTVTVNPLPTVTASPNVTICHGTATVLTASGAFTYFWSPSAGLTPIVGSSVTANPTTTTTYTVAGTDVNGCVGTASVMVSVNPLPVVSGGPSVDLCTGLSTSLTASGAITYTWGPASSLSATTGSSVTANPAATTSYTITGTDGNGCVNTAFLTVNVYALPIVSGSAIAPICIGSSTGVSAVGAVTYTWAPATGLSATTGNSLIANPASTTTYTVIGTNSHGCINSAVVTVTVYPLPVVSAGSNIAICNGSSTVLTGSGGGTYTWAPGFGLSITTGSSVTAHPIATTTYTLTVINICVNTSTVTVSVNPLPVVTATSATYCTGFSGVLTASGAATYTWVPATGLSATTGSSVTANATVNMVYSITGTDLNGCVNHTTANAWVNLLPTISAGLPATICNGSSTVLTATGGITYTWSPGTGLSATTGKTVTASPLATMTYTVIGTSPYGCVNTATVRVNVNPLPSIFTVTGGGTFCAGALGVPVGLSGSQGSGINYTLYCSGLFTGVTRTGIGSALDFGHPGSAGYYTIVATDLVTGCHDTMSGGVSITINPVPVALTVTGGGSYCPGSPGVHVGLTGSVVGVDYQLYKNTMPLGAPVAGVGYALDFGIHDTGTYTATAVYHGGSCIRNMTGSATINVLSLPAIFTVTGGGSYCQGGTGVHIGLIGSQIGAHYQVYLMGAGAFGTSLIGLNAPLDFGLFTSPGVYKVVAIATGTGCSDTMSGSATIAINPTPVITGPSMVAQHNTITLSATPAGGSWSSQDQLIVATVGTASGVVSGVSLGATNVSYTMPTGCFDKHWVTVVLNIGVPGLNAQSDIVLAPNPNSGVFTLKGALAGASEQDAVIEITNLTGQVIYSSKVTAHNGVLDERIELNMPAAIYILSLKTGRGTKVFRFVKE